MQTISFNDYLSPETFRALPFEERCAVRAAHRACQANPEVKSLHLALAQLKRQRERAHDRRKEAVAAILSLRSFKKVLGQETGET